MYALKQVNFFDAVKSCLTKYSTFRGRTRRSEYWFFMLLVNFLTIFFLTLYLLYETRVIGKKYYNDYYSDGYYYDYYDYSYYRRNEDAILALIILLCIHVCFITLPTLGATVRRLHDTGRPGEMIFIGLVPFFGALTLLVFLCSDSDREDNEFGPSPKYTNNPPLPQNQLYYSYPKEIPLINNNSIQMTNMNTVMNTNNENIPDNTNNDNISINSNNNNEKINEEINEKPSEASDNNILK